ncbi:MAG: fasciclin domain-containing protein [Saprospiraceae bacterium]|nr:fasciclin domain-containing protein [Saprospiraceae bacterium]
MLQFTLPLVAAVSAAGLVSTLQGDGPFTVFAPTDAAFAALPAGTIEALLADPQGALTDILLYHTVGANALSSGLANGQFIKTINGKSVSVKINADGVFINNAKVTVADVIADNGVVHVIDAVILPPSTVVDIALNSPVHTTLVAAVSAPVWSLPFKVMAHLPSLHLPMLLLPPCLRPSKPCCRPSGSSYRHPALPHRSCQCA